jgi:hypothetical protein
MFVLPQMVKAEDGAEAKIWVDKADFGPGKTVNIFGSGFRVNAVITVSVTWPNSQVDSWSSLASDSAGNFTTTYYLVGMYGTLSVIATDGTNRATTTLTHPTFGMTGLFLSTKHIFQFLKYSSYGSVVYININDSANTTRHKSPTSMPGVQIVNKKYENEKT